MKRTPRLLAFAASLSLLGAPVRADMLDSLAVHGGLQGIDIWSTQQARAHGAREQNPLLGSGTPGRMLVTKVPLAVGFAFLDHQIGKKSKRNQWLVRGLMVVGYGIVVRHNLRQGRR